MSNLFVKLTVKLGFFLAPTGPPTSFDLEVINATAIEAMWNLPGIYVRNGFIRGYKLFVQTRDGTTIRNITIPDNDTMAYIVGGLERATPYTFSILAYTVADGPRSIHLTAVTLRKIMTRCVTCLFSHKFSYLQSLTH